MDVFGIDFTSRPNRTKPITCIKCELDGETLRASSFEEWTSFDAFEDALVRPGPWIAGIDFPFGQARQFIEGVEWPLTWSDYVEHSAGLGRAGFRKALEDYKASRPYGDKEHQRATDKASGAKSPQKLYGVPVGLMFFEGAPRVLRSGADIPHLKQGDTQRVVVEAYPGLLVRSLIGHASYKNDIRNKQTAKHYHARRLILSKLRDNAPKIYGFSVEVADELCDDPSGDHLDAFLCAIQAAWAWRQRNNRFGAPEDTDPLEGWIADPMPAGRET